MESVNSLLILDPEDENLRDKYKWVLSSIHKGRDPVVMTYSVGKRLLLSKLVIICSVKDQVVVGENRLDYRKENLKLNKFNGNRKEAVSKRNYARWINNKERLLKEGKDRRDNYSEEKKADLREKAKLKAREKRKNDPIFCITCSIRSSLRRAIKRNQKQTSAVKGLGCSLQELKEKLEAKFYTRITTGEIMSWENFGEWHIDHVRPLTSFDMIKKEDQELAVHYTNLQPLWKEDNLKKGSKY